ncbi:hypothetical protein EG355_22240 [Serratia marcescens]|uniref:hypothetical protein n=1 Tax=Serratia marcescens TaxID=615 RepID=UPI0010371F76|nr:hypothetical protein [Serratia marcescens]TBU66586.1 hypothetical protein EG355_22240 [Serratia marcescens]
MIKYYVLLRAITLSLTLLGCTGGAHGAFVLSVIEPPEYPGAYFSAVIVGGDEHDARPNPCYGARGCDIRFFTISASWLPDGRPGYTTNDDDVAPWGIQTWEYPTIGEWWKNVPASRRARVGRDWLPLEHGTDACVVLAATSWAAPQMDEGTIMSNCAKGVVQAKSCSVAPPSIDVKIEWRQGETTGGYPVSGVSILCDSDATVTVGTNTGEIIPLNNDTRTTAVLDWGNGYGKPGRYTVRGGAPTPLPLMVKLAGMATAPAGVYGGASVVSISYQ